ncbi:MAG TPA: MinD/ParA family protein [Smithellaceae bacterium]|jgi:flagellar biosynthesis protein FlhG|nr:MinD/ParA family protein [Smithellaceae bacterium]
MRPDQAEALRTLRKKDMLSTEGSGKQGEKKGSSKRPGVRMISVTSGKGGVGKTNIAANLAYLLSRMNQKIMILDADAGLANIDVILGINSLYNLSHVLNGERTLADTLVEGPGGIKILPSASGIPEMAELSRGQKLTLIDELNNLNDSLDFMFIDTGAGISSNVMYFNMAAREIIVVTSPEPTALTDAYALIKVLYQRHAKKRFRLIVNMVRNPTEAKEVYDRLSNATDQFLNLTIEYLGYVLLDEKVKQAVLQQKAVAEIYPNSSAAQCLVRIAKEICSEEILFSDEDSTIKLFWENIIGQNCG